MHSQETQTDFRGQTVLVTGARGFIGSHLVERLLRQGATVHGTSRTPQPKTSPVRWHATAFSELSDITRLLRSVRPHVVFHLGGYVAGSRSLDAVLPAFQSHCVAALHLLHAATELGGCRIVLANSLEEPSATELDQAPCSPYAAAKFASTLYARMFHSLYGTPLTITRISMGYGPRQWDTRKLVPYVALSLLQGTAPNLSSGRRCCDWIYVDDIVSGLLAAAASPHCLGQTVDLASGEMATIADVVRHIVALLGSSVRPNFGALPDRPLERLRPANIERTYQLLRWRAATSLRDGLAETVRWYRAEFERGAISLASPPKTLFQEEPERKERL